jgi:hypothetical protein
MAPQFKPHEMVLVWDTDDQNRVTRARMRDLGPDTPETKVYSRSWGPCCRGWLGDDPLENPQGLFLRLATLNGFATNAARVELAREFARVEGQGWAVALLEVACDRFGNETPR